MTNNQILCIALQQSAIDANCDAGDFLKTENVFVNSADGYGANPLARKYLEPPIACNFISYGTNVVVSCDERLFQIVRDYVERYSPEIERCFETPAIHELDAAVSPFGLATRYMAEYFLPDVDALNSIDDAELKCGVQKSFCDFAGDSTIEFKLLAQKEFAPLYKPEWSNALCDKRPELDVLGMGAYSDGNLVGLAACSADCEEMWQIGVDVLPEFRRQKIASALTSLLAKEVFRRGKVPFYCAAWSNVKSARNAIRAGFKPAWVELTVKAIELK